MAQSAKQSAGSAKSASRNGRTAKASGSSRKSTAGRSKASASRAGKGGRKTSSAARPGTVQKVASTVGGTARKARVPILAGGATAVVVAGGALLKRRLAPKRRKVLGVPLPRPRLDGLVPSGGLDRKAIAKGISETGKRVTKASRQLAKLSDDVERAGKRTEKVGDSLT